MATTDLYSIPNYYDILHSPGTEGEVDGLTLIQKRFSGDPESPVWLEPACGSGRFLRVAAARGIRCIGFDLSPAMIEFAQEQAEQKSDSKKSTGVAESTYFVADMRNFDSGRKLPKVDFAFNPINTIRHVNTDAAMLAHFACMARVMKKKAVYAVGMSMCEYGQEPPTEDVWSGKRGSTRVTQVINYIPAFGRRGNAARTERVISHLTVNKAGEEEHIDSSYGLRSYDLEQWYELIDKSDLKIIAATDENGEDCLVPRVGYVIWILRAR